MYQVCTKDEYIDTWHLEECEDLTGVREAILAATRAGREIRISIPMEFSIDVKIKEEKLDFRQVTEKALTKRQQKEKEAAKDEATESGPEEDQGPGSKSNSPV